jgi:Protein of unknown function (DUF1761)
MLDFSGLHYAAILCAWFINIVVGSVWYSPLGFSKQWSKLSGVDMMKIPKGEANRAITFVAVSAAIQSITLAVILNSLRVDSAIDGLQIGLLLWFGFTAVTTIGNTLYARLSLKFWLLNAGFFLVVMSINSVLLSAWQ